MRNMVPPSSASSSSLKTGSSLLPPPTPKYILRGHTSPIQSLKFYAQNSRLVSGDSDGWIVVWDMATKRAVGCWKAHGGAILCVVGFEIQSVDAGQKETRIFTHGRDHKLRVWRLNTSDEANLDTKLPVDFESPANRETLSESEPWLLHSLDVNALNFCAFSARRLPEMQRWEEDDPSASAPYKGQQHFLLAAPNALNMGGIDIFHLPSQKRISTITPSTDPNKGMVMAVNLFITEDERICVVAGFEEGTAVVYMSRESIHWKQVMDGTVLTKDWVVAYANRSHTQPILSLSVPDDGKKKEWFITSSADAFIVKHPIPSSAQPTLTATSNKPLRVFNTHHASQQSVDIRSDGKLFATAGWDSKGRIYATSSMKECAILKWHREGCFAIAFAEVGVLDTKAKEETTNKELVSISPHSNSLDAIKEQRARRAQNTHWIALGSKDGKISLWDVY